MIICYYLASSVCDDNITSQTIHNINALRLSGFPRPCHEGIRFAGQSPNLVRDMRLQVDGRYHCSYWAEVDDIS